MKSTKNMKRKEKMNVHNNKKKEDKHKSTLVKLPCCDSPISSSEGFLIPPSVWLENTSNG